MAEKILEINLFDACIVRGTDGYNFEIKGTKHKALFVLLATAPFGRRTRTFFQDILWGISCFDSGRQSLRRALANIKQILDADYERLLCLSNSEITLDLTKVHFIGAPGNGTFLEGIDIAEEGFEDWLRGIRSNPDQLFSLYSLATQPPAQVALPVVTILPFRLVCGGEQHAVLGDWLAEEAFRSLSKTNLLLVISHLSAREVAGRRVDLTHVRSLLGVDYCLSGSVRVIDKQAWLDVDFLDAVSGRILWSRTFAAPVAEFLHSSSDTINDVVRSIGRTIATEAIIHTRGRELNELKDHELLIAGVGLMHELKLNSFARSRELIQEAIARAPQSAEAHAWLAEWYVMSVFNGWSTDRNGDTQAAAGHAARALDIDPESAFSLTIDGVVESTLLQRLDVGNDRFSEALKLNSNESLSWLFNRTLCAFRDEAEEPLHCVEHANTLSPLDPMGYFFDSLSATAYLAAEDYQVALNLTDRSLAKNSRHTSTTRARICALHYLGKREEAQKAASELMSRYPEFNVKDYLKSHPAADFRFGRMHAEALLASGIPKGV